MKNPFTGQTVPAALSVLSMDKTIKIDPSQPGYFSYRTFLKPDYNPSDPDGFDDISAENFTEIPAKKEEYTDGSWDVLQKELAFLDDLGLIVVTDGKRYVSPLALVFYGTGGLFEGEDFQTKLSSLSTPEDRLEFLTPVLNFFSQFVLPGRIQRVNIMRGELPDTIHYGNALTQEIAEMGAILNHIRGLL